MGKLEAKILSQCLSALGRWKDKGIVTHYERRQVRTFGDGRNIKLAEEGTSDIEAYINVNGLLWLYWIEVKREGIDTARPSQYKFFSKWMGLSNVICEIVDDYRMIDKTIEKLTGFEQSKLDAITFTGE